MDTAMNEELVAQTPPKESLFTRVKEAKQSSEGCCSFFELFLTIVYNSRAFVVSIALLLTVSVAMVIVGSIYATDCQGRTMIPVYLIVGGLVSILKITMLLYSKVKNADQPERNTITSTPYHAVLNCFLFAWFIAGNVWLFRYPEDCNQVPVTFTFILTAATYFTILVLGCCFCCGAGFTHMVTSGVKQGDN